jgi:hypothetical protein
VSQNPNSRAVKLGDILPVFANFESILSSIKAYPLWPTLVREALLDRAISGIEVPENEAEALWRGWCDRNEVDPEKPLFEGLSPVEMRKAALRERRIELFKEQTFGKHLPEYFRARKKTLDRVALEIVQFHHEGVAEEALFRCRGGEQSLEEAAHELAHRDGGEPPVKRIGPIALSRLSAGLNALVSGTKPGAIRGPRKIGQYHVVVRILEIREAALDDRMRHRLLVELLNQWIEQQMSALTGRPPRPSIPDDEEDAPVPASTPAALQAPAPAPVNPAVP